MESSSPWLTEAYRRAPEGMCGFDLELRFVLVNERFSAISDLPIEQHLGRTIGEVLPTMAESLEPILRRVLATQTPVFDCVYGAPAHPDRDLHYDFHPVMSDHGSVLGVNCTVRENADHHLAETRGQLGNHHLRLITDNISGMIAHIDADQRYRYVNRRFADAHGLPEQQFIGRHIREVLNESTYSTICRRVERVLTGELVEFKAEIDFAAIGRRSVESSYVPEFDDEGRVVGFFVLVNDVSKRAAAEKRFRDLLELAPDATIISDIDGRIVLINSQTESLLGYSREKLYGKSIEDLLPARFRSNHSSLRDQFLDEPTTRRMGGGRELSALHKDGTELPVEISISVIQSGEESLVVSAVRDITQRKKLEQDAHERQEQLLHLSRLNSLGEFASGLAHELNQPLAAIAIFAESCLHQLRSEEEQRDSIESTIAKLQQQSIRAGQIVHRLRRLVMKEPRDFQPVSVNQVVENVLAMLEPMLKYESMAIEVDYDEDIPLVFGDSLQLEQVILNLARNAADAMQDCGPADRNLFIQTAKSASGEVQILVRDSGSGIEEDNLATVFEAFFTTKSQGMGIGLPVCRSIVLAHGGTISMTRNHDRGVTAKLVVPSAKRETEDDV